MSGKQGAYAGAAAADTSFRRKWDKEEYAEKARKKDDEERERMKENEERMKQGVFILLFFTKIYSLRIDHTIRQETSEREA